MTANGVYPSINFSLIIIDFNYYLNTYGIPSVMLREIHNQKSDQSCQIWLFLICDTIEDDPFAF